MSDASAVNSNLSNSSAPDSTVSDAGMIAFFGRYVGALNERNRALALELVAEELHHNGVEMPGSVWWSDHVAANIDCLPDYVWSPDEMIVSGDRMTIRYTDSGTLAKPWVGLTELGQRIDFREYAIYTVRDERIVEIWSVFDHWSLVRAPTEG